ncbi:MAG: cation diffusion facilitator family transporter [Polyangiaceae bacterium]
MADVMDASDAPDSRGPSLYAWASLGTSVAVLGLKLVAALLTGSVGFLSDALESIVNVLGAFVALIALRVAARPASDEHPHGHGKVEYFSSGFEGALVLVAAVMILYEAIPRLITPRPLEGIGVGVAVSALACVLNFAMARALFRGAKKHRSIALEADGHHLMTDVWTSVGVLVAVGLVEVTKVRLLDPLAAIAVGLNIVRTGLSLIRRSMKGLMDTSLATDELTRIDGMLRELEREHGARFHALRTRQAGARRFVELHVLVPGDWTVRRGHDLCEHVERTLRDLGPLTTVFTHLEPLEDPVSFDDQVLDR